MFLEGREGCKLVGKSWAMVHNQRREAVLQREKRAGAFGFRLFLEVLPGGRINGTSDLGRNMVAG